MLFILRVELIVDKAYSNSSTPTMMK